MSTTKPNGNGQPGNGQPDDSARPFLETALTLGAPAARAGDQRGCAELYGCTTRLILLGNLGSADARQRLIQAQKEAEGTSDPARRALILGQAFAGLLGVALGAGPDPFANVIVHTATADGVQEARQRLQRGLDECTKLTDDDQRAWAMRHAFDEVIAMGNPGLAAGDLQEYLSLAISLGAPIYNAGDYRGCYEIYAATARFLLTSAAGDDEAQRLLHQALEQCSLLIDPNEQAWAMRHAFDAILGDAE
jgi:hypothetical protein